METKVEAISGACVLIRRSTFDEIGGFNFDFFMYAEDMDLFHKITSKGLKVIYTPSAEITHHGGGCSAQQSSLFSDI